MDIKYVVTAILLAGVITFFMRAIPLLIFNGKRDMPKSLRRLSQVLPSAIMAVLVVYCLKDVGESVQQGVSKVAAVVLVACLHKWKHNTFLSMIAGTAFYMILLFIWR